MTITATAAGDAASMAFYRENGYMVVENVLSPELCDQAIAAAATLDEAKLQSPLTAMQPHKRHGLFYDLLVHPPVRSRIEVIIGPPVVGLASQFYYCAPGSSGLMRHQDNYCVEAPDEQFGSCWIPLVDVDETNGCLVIYPGSHRWGMLPVRPLAPHEIRETYRNMLEETTLPPDAVGLTLPAKRGTGIFLHAAVVHESGPNRSAEFRYAFLGTYMRRGASFRPGNTAKREPIDLDVRGTL
jgi:ectoine hydroxylase-related dioxygenase (phytanoyl-CoA dioxygenase family)